MKALVLTTAKRQAVVEEIPRPTPGPGEVLIRVRAVALNPVDELYVSNPIATQEKRVVGTDFAGVVEGAGSDLADSSDPRTRPGTRVAGFLQGGATTLIFLLSGLMGRFMNWPPSNISCLTCHVHPTNSP